MYTVRVTSENVSSYTVIKITILFILYKEVVVCCTIKTEFFVLQFSIMYLQQKW